MKQHNISPGQNNKQALQTMFNEVFASLAYDEGTVRKHFSLDYTQTVDGKTLDFEQFCRHIRVQKQAIRSLSITFKTLAQEGDVVFSNHVARAEMVEGRTGEMHIMAEFRFQNGKITACDELTHMVSGHPQDRDLGSRH